MHPILWKVECLVDPYLMKIISQTQNIKFALLSMPIVIIFGGILSRNKIISCLLVILYFKFIALWEYKIFSGTYNFISSMFYADYN